MQSRAPVSVYEPPYEDGFYHVAGTPPRPAPLHAPRAPWPHPFDCLPLTAPLATSVDDELQIRITKYQPSPPPHVAPLEPEPDAATWRALLALVRLVGDGGAFLCDVLLFIAFRQRLQTQGRLFYRTRPSASVEPELLYLVWEGADFTWRAAAQTAAGAPPSAHAPANTQASTSAAGTHGSAPHADESIPDLVWRYFHTLCALDPWVQTWRDRVRRYCVNLVKNRLVMLQSRGWKGVPLHGWLEWFNRTCERAEDALPLQLEFRELRARSKAPELRRWRYVPLAQKKLTEVNLYLRAAVRECPYVYTHTFGQTHAALRALTAPECRYRLAAVLLAFVPAHVRPRVSRELDAASRAQLPEYVGSLMQPARLLQAALYPELPRLCGGLWRLRLTHYVAPVGLCAAPPLSQWTRTPHPEADARVQWRRPLPLQSAAPAPAAAAASTAATAHEGISAAQRAAAVVERDLVLTHSRLLGEDAAAGLWRVAPATCAGRLTWALVLRLMQDDSEKAHRWLRRRLGEYRKLDPALAGFRCRLLRATLRHAQRHPP